MSKESDISKTLAFVLIILTVMISAASTWVLVDRTMSSEPESSFNDALIRLHILRGQVEEPVQTDTNAGDVRLYIADKRGG